MPHVIDCPPFGFAATSAPHGSETVLVRLKGFHSSEDGNAFTACLDGLSGQFLDKLPPSVRPRESRIDHLVAVITRDSKATVYCNELDITLKARVKRPMQAGEGVTNEDITDIAEVALGGIQVPCDAGFVALFSVRWSKAVYYDLVPIAPVSRADRTDDVAAIMAGMFSYLIHQDRLAITEAQWAELFRQRWFPFIGHTSAQLRSLLTHADMRVSIDHLLPEMLEHARALSASLRSLIGQRSELAEHRLTLSKALEHFENGDYVSSIPMLYSRIEGVLKELRDTLFRRYITRRLGQGGSCLSAAQSRPTFA